MDEKEIIIAEVRQGLIEKLEYLEETLLDQFARNIRSNTRRFMGRYEEDDEIF